MWKDLGAEIVVMPLSCPMFFNRMRMVQLGDVVRSTTINYFVPTKVMSGTKVINDNEYVDFRLRFMMGEFRPEISDTVGVDKFADGLPDSYTPMFYLTKGEDVNINGKMYGITNQSNGIGSGKPISIQYLYEIFSLDGHADIRINGKHYVLRDKPIALYNEDAVLATFDNGAVVGKRK